jgi:tRNA dimethylallyltransferase
MLEANLKKVLVVCGPTASGKSEFSDALAGGLTEAYGGYVPTLVVDSMQVYREIPVITNQARRRPAELAGIVSVTEEWTVARHKVHAEEIIEGLDTPFVLDSGTGMYLNAILLDIPLAPKVEASTRQLAQEITANATNPRRASRAKELQLAGIRERGSIWEGNLRHDTTMFYLRPRREALKAAIFRRSKRTARDGLEEVAKMREMAEAGAKINASVKDSIGVRELMQHLVGGKTTIEEVESQICTRTRQLAWRQIRWFDKLARTLQGRADIRVAESPADIDLSNYMHDRIEA